MAILGICFFVGCEKSDPISKRKDETSHAVETEQELIAKRQRLRADVDQMKARENDLLSDISTLENQSAELKEHLAFVNAERERMMEEVGKLQKLWEKELEGFEGGSINRPLHEIFRDMTQEVDRLLQENKELKRKLEAAGK